MKSLSQTWFAEGYIDFELKKYTLLAYLQSIHQYFDAQKLYPQLADVIFHYNNLLAFKNNKESLQQQFPKRLNQVDMRNLELLYEQIVSDDELMKELEDIIHYSLQMMNATIRDGAEIYEFVEDKLNINPVGIIPLDNREGYFFLNDGLARDTLVYYYRLSFFEKHEEKYRNLKTEYVSSWERNMVNTYENIKGELLRSNSELPNPAVYAIETTLQLPIEETLLPVAKRSLVKFISTPSA